MRANDYRSLMKFYVIFGRLSVFRAGALFPIILDSVATEDPKMHKSRNP